MACNRSPRQQLREAMQIAADYGMQVAERSTERGTLYTLYRGANETDRTYLGRAGTPQGLLALAARHAWPASGQSHATNRQLPRTPR